MMTWMGFFFNSPNSSAMQSILLMHDYVLMFLISILVMVFFLMVNLTKSSFFNMNFFEDEQLEAIWTVLPFLVLTAIMGPSLVSLFMLESSVLSGLTVTVVGHQWYWSYFYKDMGQSFDSYMIPSAEYMEARLLEVDNTLVIPVSVPSRVLATSADVLHSWTVPSMGFKVDAVPGRINQVSIFPKTTGTFFGQCSEICGVNHSFMPICVEVVSVADFVNL